ncbi:MAG: transaldolase [candidate division WOR-3 bacterium]|nr:MAG: transaldolase [candidate division WOR-3 bacterium]
MPESIFKLMSDCGQSIWLDYISRSLIDTGRLEDLIASGLRGMTSNPTIFDNAVSKSSDYDGEIRKLRAADKSTIEIYDEITIGDIRDAADAFARVYDETGGVDGYVSLEIDPRMANDAAATIEEGRRLHHRVDRPNVMFKVPATEAGYTAVSTLVSESINVNMTLIFSVEQYTRTADAYLGGIELLLKKGGDARSVRSVASVFVSRVDTLVDKLIEEKLQNMNMKDRRGSGELARLKGKSAIANSVVIYDKFQSVFSSEKFRRLEKNGCHLQRIVWGSTSTKNPEYSDIKYVTELIGPDTVNTIPQETLDAFIDHGSARQSLPGDVEHARAVLDDLARAGIGIDGVCSRLLVDGVTAFQRSFDSLLRSIEQKAAAL